jgi:hypothetical protein
MAYETEKLDWLGTDRPTNDDMNRIEGNIAYLKAALDALTASVAAHTGETDIHKTAAEIRADGTLPLVVELRTSDPSSPATGSIWERTD